MPAYGAHFGVGPRDMGDLYPWQVQEMNEALERMANAAARQQTRQRMTMGR